MKTPSGSSRTSSQDTGLMDCNSLASWPEALARIEHSINDLRQQLLILPGIHTRLDLIRRFIVLKEVAPELINQFKMQTSFSDDFMLFMASCYSDIKYIGQIENWFVEESERMIWFASERQSPLSFDSMEQTLIDCMNRGGGHKYSCYHSLANLYWKFRPFGAELDELFRRVEADPHSWERMHKDYWPKYIVFLLATGDIKKAKQILHRAIKGNGYAYIDLYLPAADLAVKCNYKFVKFKQASAVYRAFNKSEEQDAFASFIRGKRVAIVGNGPQEIGTGNGKIIDQYDVVIRFNDFVGSIAKKQDYGQKTDIWVRWAGILTDVPSAIYEKIKIFLAIENLWHEQLGYNMTVKLEKLVEGGRTIASLPNDVYLKIRTLVHRPSSGFSIICLVKSINPYLSRDDVFGFSFKSDATPVASAGHADGSRDKRLFTIHNIDFEREVLNNTIFCSEKF